MKGGFYMSKKGLKLGIALAAGAGAAAMLAKKLYRKIKRSKLQKQRKPKLPDLTTAIQNAANTKRTAKASTIQMVTTKHLPARRNRKA